MTTCPDQPRYTRNSTCAVNAHLCCERSFVRQQHCVTVLVHFRHCSDSALGGKAATSGAVPMADFLQMFMQQLVALHQK
jgi:hypothetical protein